ncbi:N-acetylmuramoyl-L-alanine amidase [Deinococcus altitudinis]|uniref:N-acetylmuramoyl-L-alanine amidase family protein n=1 Tax=Deinococcus altitudinis TaxID=468914 RepID=UPI003891407E
MPRPFDFLLPTMLRPIRSLALCSLALCSLALCSGSLAQTRIAQTRIQAQPAPATAAPNFTVPTFNAPIINSPVTTASVTTAPIYVAYPKDGYRVAADHVIFEGSVLPGATLSVNGRSVVVGPDGLFIEWLPLKPGLNTLSLVSVGGGKTSTLTYSVTSAPPGSPARTGAEKIVPGSLTPDGPWVRYGVDTLSLPDRRLEFSFSGRPGGRAMFWVGQRGPFTMTEARSGRYSGGYTLGNTDAFSAAPVRFMLTLPDGSRAQATAPGSVSSLPGPRYAEVTAPDLGRGINSYQAAWAPAGGLETIYPRQGVRFSLVGENTGNFLTRLPGRPAPGVPELPLLEVTRSTAKVLPAGTVFTPAQLLAPEIQDAGSHLALRLPLGAKVPYLLAQTTTGLRLSLYDTLGDPATLNALPLSDPLLTGIVWSQQRTGPLTAEITLNTRQQWGYDAVYDGTALVVQARRPPAAPTDPALILSTQPLTTQSLSTQALSNQPLAGRTIVIDPGHGGSETGGAGPLRVNEKDIVLAIGLEVAARLKSAGASVVLTRQTDVQVPIYNRPQLAETLDADLLVSIHANALPDGTDPRTRRGAGVYFTNPQAGPLARSILEAIVGNPVLAALGQPGNDGLHPDADLALTRPSSQISLLVETAYLTDPGNLRSLMSSQGRGAYAEAIAAGILKFYADSASPVSAQP